MKSTLYLKFIIIYIIFAFLSVFTVATLTSSLIQRPLVRIMASDAYQDANMMATELSAGIFF